MTQRPTKSSYETSSVAVKVDSASVNKSDATRRREPAGVTYQLTVPLTCFELADGHEVKTTVHFQTISAVPITALLYQPIERNGSDTTEKNRQRRTSPISSGTC